MTLHWPSFVLLLLALYCAIEFVANLCLSREDRRAIKTRGRLRSLAAHLQAPDTNSRAATIVRQRLGSGARNGSGFHLDGFLEGLPLFRALELLLYRAGLSIGCWRFLSLTAIAAFAAGAVTLQVFLAWPQAIAAAVAAPLLSFLWVWRRKRRRMSLFELQFPEALELVCRALRAGHALSAGIRMVANELDGPIAVEFGQMADEIALGMETREALANLCHRIDVQDLGFFSTAVLIQRETGGNLAEVMERLGYVIRERHKFYGKVRAMTAQNRGAALVLLFTPPAFLLLMHQVSEDFIEPLYATEQGRILGWVAAALTIFGYALARRLAVVKA